MTDEDFMREALRLAKTALEKGEFPVGCVLVWEGGIVAAGARTGSAGAFPNETDHAEMTALRRLDPGIPPAMRGGVTAYCSLEPCLMCFGALMIHGVGRIVYAYEDAMGGGTACDLSGLPPLYRARKVDVAAGVLRAESLSLFKAYFENPVNAYWRGSRLAEYTLKQP